MKILMATNTYLNVVGGLEKSVLSFASKFRELKHGVAIAGTDFVEISGNTKNSSLPLTRHPLFSLPFRAKLERIVAKFNADIIHAHHPFLMGEMALRFSAYYDKPVVFTYHIMFDQYSHYLPLISPSFSKRFLTELAVGFCNLCTRVIAPSESVRKILRAQGVKAAIDVVPTGVEAEKYLIGNRGKKRKELGLSEKAVLLGCVGRLAPEKNLDYLASQVLRFMQAHDNAYFFVAGKGPSCEMLKNIFSDAGLQARLLYMGALQGQDLIDSYHAMDVFVFASESETQGMVITEAMAAGIPVVALDAPGVREVVQDFENGRIVFTAESNEFQSAIEWCVARSAKDLASLKQKAIATAGSFSVDKCALRALEVYRMALQDYSSGSRKDQAQHKLLRCVRIELLIILNFVRAAILATRELFPKQAK